MFGILNDEATPEQDETLDAIGFRNSKSRDDSSWRCGKCSDAQRAGSRHYWVPDRASSSDPLWAVSDFSRTNCSAWCFRCVRHWLRDTDVAAVAESRKKKLEQAWSELVKPKTINERMGWDYTGWYEGEGRRHKELAEALVSRPLTVAELKDVGREGYRILIQPMESYNQAEKMAEFAAMLSIQQSIQLAASRESTPKPEA